MLRGGQISSRELTRLALARIDTVNPSLNAIVELRREAALQEAAAADEAIARGELTGPLHGVPVTVKEAIQVAGMRSTWEIPRSKTSSPIAMPPWCSGCGGPGPLWWEPAT